MQHITNEDIELWTRVESNIRLVKFLGELLKNVDKVTFYKIEGKAEIEERSSLGKVFKEYTPYGNHITIELKIDEDFGK